LLVNVADWSSESFFINDNYSELIIYYSSFSSFKMEAELKTLEKQLFRRIFKFSFEFDSYLI
jgi:hypothetical protein